MPYLILNYEINILFRLADAEKRPLFGSTVRNKFVPHKTNSKGAGHAPRARSADVSSGVSSQPRVEGEACNIARFVVS